MVRPFRPDEEKLAQIRELLPATGAGIYLDAATAGPFPAETARALAEADDWELRVGRVGPGRAEDIAQRAAEAKAVVAALLGVDPDGVVLTFGARDSVARLARLAAALGRVEPVDLSLVAGASPITLDGEDAAVIDGHRWLLGPEGTGALWVGARLRSLVDPAALEAAGGLVPRRSLLGLARSVGWLEMYVGLPWIHERTARLALRMTEGLRAIEGVDLRTPPDGPAVATFSIRGWTGEQAQDELSRRVFAIVGLDPDRDAIRASVGFWNSDEELDRFLEAVGEVAAHTPGTLPRRPSLTVLQSPGNGA